MIKTYKHTIWNMISAFTTPNSVCLPRSVTFKTNQTAAIFIPTPSCSVNPVYSKHSTPVPRHSRSVNASLSGGSCRDTLLAWNSSNNYHMQSISHSDFIIHLVNLGCDSWGFELGAAIWDLLKWYAKKFQARWLNRMESREREFWEE